MKQALYWHKSTENRADCALCPHLCSIKPCKSGICRVRSNKEGVLYSDIYGEVTSVSLDPIEKKPLYHFYPGANILSIGTNGCNLSCGFCQNWQISQTGDSGRDILPPEKAAELAGREGSIGLAYTYNEPLIWFEYVLDTAKEVKKLGLKNVLVTNGYINEAPLSELLPYIDAMNIDLKGITDEFYKSSCGATLAPVKRTIETAVKKCHLELTNLVIPGKNDSEKDLKNLIDYVAGIGRDIPLHFSRYFPKFKAKEEETPSETLELAFSLAKKKLDFVYIGNAHIPGADDTSCAKCGNTLILRKGYSIFNKGLAKGKCSKCGNPLKGSF